MITPPESPVLGTEARWICTITPEGMAADRIWKERAENAAREDAYGHLTWVAEAITGNANLYGVPIGAAPESFADAPISLNEVKADRSGTAEHLTPRDVLIRLLRDIDAGRVEPLHLALVYRDGDDRICADYATTGRRHETVGMLQMAMHTLIDSP